MTDNIEKIVQEAECVAAADEYFKARAWLMDTNENRRIFEAGFDRAYVLLSKLRAEGVQASFLLEEALGYIRSFSIPGKTAEDMTAIAQAGVRRFTAALASAPVAGEAQKPVAWPHQCRKKPELATVTMNKREPALAAKGYRPMLYAVPQASEAVRSEYLERANKLPKVECPRCELKVISSCGSKGCPTNDGYADLCQTQADKDGGDCAKGAGDVEEAFEAWLYLGQTEFEPSDLNKDAINLAQLAYSAGRAALSTPSVVKQSLTATQTGEKGESE